MYRKLKQIDRTRFSYKNRARFFETCKPYEENISYVLQMFLCFISVGY